MSLLRLNDDGSNLLLDDIRMKTLNREPLSEAELAAIEARASAASPEPWSVGSYRGVGEDYDLVGPAEPIMRGMIGSRADAEFIVAARTDVPRLVAEVRRLQARIRELEAD